MDDGSKPTTLVAIQNDWRCVGGDGSGLETVEVSGNVLGFKGVISSVHY